MVIGGTSEKGQHSFTGSGKVWVFDIALLLSISYRIKSLLFYVVVNGGADKTCTQPDSSRIGIYTHVLERDSTSSIASSIATISMK